MAEQVFNSSIMRLFGSWKYVNEKYKSQLDDLQKSCGEFSCDGKYPVIWQTRSKFVLLLTLNDGTQLVYKAPKKLRSPMRYMFRPSPWGKEAVNFQRLSQIGLPLVKLAAVGETRKFFILKHGFLMTQFASGFSDGGAFLENGELKDSVSLRDEFISRNFQYLAKMHKAGFIHKGFTPYNLLFKLLPCPDAEGNQLELKWIDVASCEKPFCKINFKTKAVRDLSLFFHFFKLEDSVKIRLLETYCRHNPDISTDAEKLLDVIKKNQVRTS